MQTFDTDECIQFLWSNSGQVNKAKYKILFTFLWSYWGLTTPAAPKGDRSEVKNHFHWPNLFTKTHSVYTLDRCVTKEQENETPAFTAKPANMHSATLPGLVFHSLFQWNRKQSHLISPSHFPGLKIHRYVSSSEPKESGSAFVTLANHTCACSCKHGVTAVKQLCVCQEGTSSVMIADQRWDQCSVECCQCDTSAPFKSPVQKKSRPDSSLRKTMCFGGAVTDIPRCRQNHN